MTADQRPGWLRWYPPTWRDRYGDELVQFMQDSYRPERVPWRPRLSLVAGGLRERARQSGLSGDSAPAPDRLRAGELLVLVGWAGFVLAGSSFAKFSEHFDNALPGGINSHLPPASHAIPDIAYTVVQWAAAVAGIVVLLGAAAALPAFVTFVRSGGWLALRGHILRAAAASTVTASVTIPLVLWAHHLTAHQRNGGNGWYGHVFLGWAALMALTLGMWTAVAVVAVRRVSLSRPVLLAESALALIVATAMATMLAATSVWWPAMATDAPSFLTSSAGGGLVNPVLAATVALMLTATAAGIGGVVRVAHNLS